jgi:hypothetical protein
MMKVTIKRSEWYRGNGGKGSALLRDVDGMKCCVGFFALACGMERDVIMGRSEIRDVPNYDNTELPEPAKWMAEYGAGWLLNTDDAREIYNLNDRPVCELTTKSEEERERGLAELFAKHDVELEFVD